MQTRSKDLEQSELPDKYAFKYMAPQQTILDLPNPFQSAVVVGPPPGNVQGPILPHNGMDGQGEAEPERLVHAAIVDVNDIQKCHRENGEDWLLGTGSYGMVSPTACLGPVCLSLPLPSPDTSSDIPLNLPLPLPLTIPAPASQPLCAPACTILYLCLLPSRSCHYLPLPLALPTLAPSLLSCIPTCHCSVLRPTLPVSACHFSAFFCLVIIMKALIVGVQGQDG